MAQLGRPGLTAGQKAELWRRWKNGQSLSDIGRALGKHAGSVHGVIANSGSNWTRIPRQTGQPFQSKLDTDSTANWTVK
jgi:hypothetical protein